jgi:ABC-type Fe3+-hydroxamate transport system substrate-binding protein
MKRILLAAILMAFTLGAFAQVSSEDLAIIQSVYSKDKSDIIKSKLNLSDAQGKAFWPLYDQYEAKRVRLSNQRVAIINDYLKKYDQLNGQSSTALMNRVFANDKAFTNLQQSYFPQFAAAVGGKNAAKFYQLENYLQLIVRLHVQDEIPFIGELDKEKH